jgi:CRP-like cAMP-binding protein
MSASEVAARVSTLAPKFLEGLAPHEIAEVLAAAKLRQYRAHSLLASEGDHADKVFLILEGRARTFTTTQRGEKVLIHWIPAGDPSGGRAFLSEGPMEYLLSTEAVADSSVLVWERSAILPLSRKYPRLLENALLIASDYLTAYRDLYVAANYDTAPRRVAWVLDKLAKAMGERVGTGIELVVSNGDLAIEANVSTFTVSRLLNEWQRKGLLLKSRGKVVIRSVEELLRAAA